ncbi:MAG: CBS domain-containing protein [Candidatus Woesearchaeota archaeon]|jgi:CBS domain-containing protein
MQTGIRVIDAMTKMPITVSADSTIEECAKRMDRDGVGSLLVMDGSKLAGILTERDLTRRVLAKALPPLTTTARDIMTTDIVYVQPDMDIFDAVMRMNDFDVRHTPVLHNGEFVGFLTHKDILKIQPDLFDIFVNKFSLREEDDKPIMGRT